jgi:hypothetical protein
VATMGKYCKAYLLRQFREFSKWTEKAGNARKEKELIDGKEIEAVRKLTDDAILYLHESYVVTDGVFRDENVIFDDVMPEWIEYCRRVLEFEIPDFAQGEVMKSTAQGTKEE